MRDPSTPRVFLSYSRKDGLEFARGLQAMLEAEGLSLYRDLSDLEGGEDWWRQVETAIKTVEHVVMVLSPNSLQSRYVRDEWKLARQEGKSVWPVSGPGELDLSHLPRWMARANRHDIAIPESRDRLILGLRGPAREKRVPFMADPLPSGFVERPEKFAEIKKKLLDTQGEPIAITAALRGAGGFGKTALANALCHDPEIEDAFSDGILRVVLGEKPEDLVGLIADLIVVVTGERPDVTHLEGAKAKLAESLDDRRCLLVIDDAWREQDLAPFLHRGPRDQTTRLITTRDDRVLPANAARVAVDAMTSSQALAMLTRGLQDMISPSLEVRLTALAVRLGEWPLLLGLANGVLRTRTARGSSLDNALSYAERALTQRGLAAAFPAQDRAVRRTTAAGTLEVSLEQLGEAERTLFAELAVFVEDAEIPTSAALGLWRQTAGLDPLDGEDLLTRLDELSLLIDLDLGRGLFRLHDVFRNLLRSGSAKDRLAELDGKLVAHLRSSCTNDDLTLLKDSYGLRYAIAHMRGAGESEAANQLLLDPAWMQAKLDALGIQLLLVDYVGQSSQPALYAIGAALSLAANALACRPRELPAQLLARLSPEDATGLEACLTKARSHIVPPALVPLRPTFTAPGAELRRFEGHEKLVISVTALADGRRALSGSWDGTLRLWDLETGAELRRFEGRDELVSNVTVLADGRHALSGSWDRTLRLWNLETGAELRRFEGHDDLVTTVTVLADGRRALSGSDDRTLRLWNLETGAELRRFEGHDDWVTSVALLADGRRALSGSKDRALRLWDLETGTELRRFEGHEKGVSSVAVLSDGRRALSGYDDGTLCLWNLDTGVELRRFVGHDDLVAAVSVLPDGRRALSASWDNTLRLWDLDAGVELRRFTGHESSVYCVTVLADGRRALSGSTDRTLRLWDLETGAELRRFEGHEHWVRCVAVLPNERRILSGSDDQTLRLWDLETGTQLQRFEGHEGWVRSVAVLADGRRALSGSRDQTLRLWDLETGSELRRFEGHDDLVSSLCLLADRRRVLSASWDKTLRLWDVESGIELRCFEGHDSSVNSVTVLADGRRALSGSSDKTLRLWDLDTGVELRCFEGHDSGITSVMALVDGRRVLSGSVDRTLRLWDIETGAELRRFEGHENSVRSVAVLADGWRALSVSEDKTLRMWHLETGAELTCLTFDATLFSLTWSEQMSTAIVGDAIGLVHVIGIQ